jgi:hypothetical protein
MPTELCIQELMSVSPPSSPGQSGQALNLFQVLIKLNQQPISCPQPKGLFREGWNKSRTMQKIQKPMERSTA